MAGYKVPQDVEAEDKFLGPLTFKQFLFAGGGAISGYLLFIFATKGVWIGVVMLFPIFAVLAILAFPWSKDQPTEIWLASRIRFFLVPRRRIWDQSGMKDLVEITVPKKEIKYYSDGLSHDQVYSRVNALASVVDTRGWAVKNALAGITPHQQIDETDRLVQATLPTPTENDQILAATVDVMDEQSNPIAAQFSDLIQESEERHRKDTQSLIDKARRATESPEQTPSNTPQDQKLSATDMSFITQQPQASPPPGYVHFQDNAVVAPGAQSTVAMGMGVPQTTINQTDEENLLNKVHAQKARDAEINKHSHLKTIQPIGTAPVAPSSDMTLPAVQDPISTSTAPVDPAIISLSTNDDLTVETLARQAKKDMPDEGEVVISLH